MFSELLGTSTGILYVWLMARQSVWCWPVGIIYIGSSYVVFFHARLYAELASHTVYLFLTLYGWYNWITKSKETPFVVTSIERKDVAFLLSLNVVASALFGMCLSRYTDNALPYLDASLAILSFTGMWLSAKKIVENWHIWIGVNLASIGMYARQGLYFYMALYALFLVMAFWGIREWKSAKSPS